MRLNPEKIKALCALPDAQMWASIRSVAASHGITLPEKCPDEKTMSEIRSAASGGVKINLSEAIRVINSYKKGER
jgi:hypothetical protein